MAVERQYRVQVWFLGAMYGPWELAFEDVTKARKCFIETVIRFESEGSFSSASLVDTKANRVLATY